MEEFQRPAPWNTPCLKNTTCRRSRLVSTNGGEPARHDADAAGRVGAATERTIGGTLPPKTIDILR